MVKKIILKSFYKKGVVEAGCDEAGRGCLAGPVFAAAVILPPDYIHSLLNDSKKLSEDKRYILRPEIEKEALAFSVAYIDNRMIDRINIGKASILAMHKAIDNLTILPEHLIIDGNRFIRYKNILHTCIVKGDAKYLSIAAASVLAKTYRDDFMNELHKEYPVYKWNVNKGYPTQQHREAIVKYRLTSYHRKTFRMLKQQTELEF